MVVLGMALSFLTLVTTRRMTSKQTRDTTAVRDTATMMAVMSGPLELLLVDACTNGFEPLSTVERERREFM